MTLAADNYLDIIFSLTMTLDIMISVVIKLQVGLLGTARSIQKELDKIAQVADTSKPKGLSYVLQGEASTSIIYAF